MKFKRYLEHLNKIAESHPETLKLDVVYTSDDEGNHVGLVTTLPGTVVFDKANSSFGDDKKHNAICIN